MYPIKVDKMRTTSEYGKKRVYYVSGVKHTDIHKGIDLVAEPKDNKAKIVAIADGVVVGVRKTGKNNSNNSSDGCYVRIKHTEKLYTLYYHLKSKSIKVNKGDKVKAGDVLGVIGETGMATGVHLHFQIDGGSSVSAINPTEYAYGKKELITNTSNTHKKLYLPASAEKWRVYGLKSLVQKGREVGFLRPAKFGGLEYDIIKMVDSNVAIIKTRDFGEVKIYVAPSTGAIIK